VTKAVGGGDSVGVWRRGMARQQTKNNIESSASVMASA